MKTLVVAALIVVPVLLGEDVQTGFDVKKIEPEKITALQDANRKFDAAVDAFNKARAELDKAKAARDDVAAKAKAPAGEFESECSGYNAQSRTYQSSAKYRRAEIRGDYLLISEGMRPCGFSVGLTTLVAQ